MSAITFAVEIDPKKKKSGLHEIRVRMTQSRKHKRFNVGYAIEEKHWNQTKRQVRNSHALATIINAAIKTKITELEKIYIQSIPTEKTVTIQELKDKATNQIGGLSFSAYFEDFIKIKKNGSTRLTVRRVYAKFMDFWGKDNIYFDELTTKVLEDFEFYLRNECSNIDSTVHHNIRTVKSVWNHAVNLKKYKPTDNPFLGFSVPKGKSKRSKLTQDEIRLIENYKFPPGSDLFNAQQFFLLSYYLLGIRVSSMLKMKWENIIENRCVYEAAKGGKIVDAIINSSARKILDYYFEINEEKSKEEKSEYIFPYIAKGRVINIEDEKDAKYIESLTSQINILLTEIRIKVGITKSVSTHVARHSFAYNARKVSNNDIYAIQKALGHSSIATTENYFGSEEVIEADELSKKLFGD